MLQPGPPQTTSVWHPFRSKWNRPCRWLRTPVVGCAWSCIENPAPHRSLGWASPPCSSCSNSSPRPSFRRGTSSTARLFPHRRAPIPRLGSYVDRPGCRGTAICPADVVCHDDEVIGWRLPVAAWSAKRNHHSQRLQRRRGREDIVSLLVRELAAHKASADVNIGLTTFVDFKPFGGNDFHAWLAARLGVDAFRLEVLDLLRSRFYGPLSCPGLYPWRHRRTSHRCRANQWYPLLVVPLNIPWIPKLPTAGWKLRRHPTPVRPRPATDGCKPVAGNVVRPCLATAAYLSRAWSPRRSIRRTDPGTAGKVRPFLPAAGRAGAWTCTALRGAPLLPPGNSSSRWSAS